MRSILSKSMEIKISNEKTIHYRTEKTTKDKLLKFPAKKIKLRNLSAVLICQLPIFILSVVFPSRAVRKVYCRKCVSVDSQTAADFHTD